MISRMDNHMIKDQKILTRAAMVTLSKKALDPHRYGLASCDAIRSATKAFYVASIVEKYRRIMGFRPEGGRMSLDEFFLFMERIEPLQYRQELRCWLLLMAAAAWEDFD